jgi:5-methylcytosine-specific restriction endonuclease McrA
LSEVKLSVLKALWDAGEEFPKNWMRSSVLLNLTKQKYFDRRIRELRDVCGCDIETEYHDGEHCYRIKSATLGNYKPRLYLSKSLKEKLYKMSDFSCSICKKPVLPGVRGLQADHREPLSRKTLIKEDVSDLKNWQPICNECNVIKRRICAKCDDNCQECPWAYPEQHGMSIFINIPIDLEREIRSRGMLEQGQIKKFILNAIKKYIQ